MTATYHSCHFHGCACDSVIHSTTWMSAESASCTAMPQQQPLTEIVVQNDQFCVSREAKLLVSELRAALAICVYDDTQAVGGLLHLRYVATNSGEPIDLTDNTLSSDLLLMDRFCKELRSAGARKQSWRVSIIGHTPEDPEMEGPAATVLDLAKAYFQDARLP